uniref:exodeoxyribonuclease III n=1 Tax=Kryptolebias marmoratus TaxID=37003 RepID=A0A3Q3A9K4_KRYMA
MREGTKRQEQEIKNMAIGGSNNAIKRKAILNSLKKDGTQVAFLQETHLTDEEHKKYLREWVGQAHFSSYSTNKRGVIILIHKNLPFTALDTFKDTEGRIILIKGTLYGESFLLGSVYSPNVNDKDFFAVLLNQIAEMDCPNILIGGDFNCSLCPHMDRCPPKTQSKNARAVKNILKELDLIDIWRHLNPLTKSFTFHSLPNSTMTRIDYLYMSNHLVHLVEDSEIGTISLSDHAPVRLTMQPPRPLDRTASWRLNKLLLLNEDFTKLLEEKTNFYLELNDNNNTHPRLVWDAYKAFMRGIIISYSSHRRKDRLAEQNKIGKEIKKLEEEYMVCNSVKILGEIKSARALLSDIITKKAKKDILFAQQKFFEHGNKPNKFLARIVNKSLGTNFIASIQDENGRRHVDNKHINECFKQFYEKLYRSEVKKEASEYGLLNNLKIPQLAPEQANLLEGPITTLEIEKAIS